MLVILLLGGLLLVSCDVIIEDPVESCVISAEFKGAECGKRDLNIRHRSVGDFIGETKFKELSHVQNYVCFAPKPWSVIIKPKLKEANTKYRQRKRKRK